MNTTLYALDWFQSYSEYPGDQQADLHGGYWAEIGTEGEHGWSWTIIRDSEDIESGRTADEAGAKTAVADWAEADLLVAEITGDLLSAAFTAYGHTPAAVAHAALAVAATNQITR